MNDYDQLRAQALVAAKDAKLKIMNKRILGPELSKAINRRAQVLSVQSFGAHRATLEQTAMAMLREGNTREQVMQAIPLDGVRHDLGAILA